MGLFRKKKNDDYEIVSASNLSDENRRKTISMVETERSIKQQDIEEVLFEIGKKSGRRSLYNKKRLKNLKNR